jgi:hypothetical protein
MYGGPFRLNVVVHPRHLGECPDQAQIFNAYNERRNELSPSTYQGAAAWHDSQTAQSRGPETLGKRAGLCFHIV